MGVGDLSFLFVQHGGDTGLLMLKSGKCQANQDGWSPRPGVGPWESHSVARRGSMPTQELGL